VLAAAGVDPELGAVTPPGEEAAGVETGAKAPKDRVSEPWGADGRAGE